MSDLPPSWRPPGPTLDYILSERARQRRHTQLFFVLWPLAWLWCLIEGLYWRLRGGWLADE